MNYNYVTVILIVLIKISFQTKSQAELNSNANFYTYLPPGQGSFHFNITQSVSFDRKQFHDIWIYKNGLITLGEPLEESDYPIMIEHGVPPFENIVGSNIIAVFIMKNKMLPGSIVRVKQNPLKLVDAKTQQLIKLIESRIHEVYGSLVISKIENVIDIEWIKMKPEGIEDDKTNTYRLLLLSTKTQTFCVFHFMKIDSIIYKIKGKSFIYQSGLVSYSDMKHILPTYNVSRNDNQLQWTSNVGLENIWLLTIGDTSYNIDFGWPSQRMIYSSSGEKFTNRNIYEKFKESTSQTMIPTKSNIPLMKSKIVSIKKALKSKRTAENMMKGLVKSTNLPDSLISTNRQLVDFFETKRYREMFKTESDKYKSTPTIKEKEKYTNKYYESETTNKYWNDLLSTSYYTRQQKINRLIKTENDIIRDFHTTQLNDDSETSIKSTTNPRLKKSYFRSYFIRQ